MGWRNNGVVRGRVAAGVANLFPGYFALVMATGIVSIAAFLLEMWLIASSLLVVNIAAYRKKPEDILAQFPESEYQSSLKKLIAYTVERQE